MTSYDAAITLTDGKLQVTRPHPAPDTVEQVIDSLLYTIREEGSGITAATLTIDADTPTPPSRPLISAPSGTGITSTPAPPAATTSKTS